MALAQQLRDFQRLPTIFKDLQHEPVSPSQGGSGGSNPLGATPLHLPESGGVVTDIFPDPLSQAMAEGWRAGVAKQFERQNAALLPAQPVAS